MKEVQEQPTPKTYGKRIQFQIEMMHTMLAAGREQAALAAINNALQLCDEVHEWEIVNGK